MNELLPLTLSGIPIAMGILLIVGALKVGGLIKNGDEARRANVLVGLLLGAIWFIRESVPSTAHYIDLAYLTLVSSLTAGLAYEGMKSVAAELRKTEPDHPEVQERLEHYLNPLE